MDHDDRDLRVLDEMRGLVVDEDQLGARVLENVRDLAMCQAGVDGAYYRAGTEHALIRLWKTISE